uniref:RNA-directed DNA polymerase, eukaryota n=1 Tax=Tanacetum cinerariifolium TaxID=118510 RepID=A0A6L2K920_TANCI|nr:RNA-directed DNA polymerase, eukaryota [Tanacetum cinerariifolium]
MSDHVLPTLILDDSCILDKDFSLSLIASLIDLPLDGYAYTWAHKTSNKMSKLDRFLVSKGLLALFPYLLALCLDTNLPDHRPILMRELSIDYSPTPFRFFHSWFNLDGFEKMVKDTLKSLSTINSNGGSNEEILSDRSLLLKELNDINSIDSLEAAKKSKVRWAIEGDKNTKFFHGILNSKCSQLAICETFVDGEWIIDSLAVKNMLSLEQQADLKRNVSNEEIKSAVWDCGTIKSPGPDDFTFEFFRRYWKLLEHDIVAVVKEFFASGCFRLWSLIFADKSDKDFFVQVDQESDYKENSNIFSQGIAFEITSYESCFSWHMMYTGTSVPTRDRIAWGSNSHLHFPEGRPN